MCLSFIYLLFWCIFLFLKREPPAMFRKEKDDISKYMMEISSSSADDPVHVNNQIDNFVFIIVKIQRQVE